jgi:hypothetical protein
MSIKAESVKVVLHYIRNLACRCFDSRFEKRIREEMRAHLFSAMDFDLFMKEFRKTEVDDVLRVSS